MNFIEAWPHIKEGKHFKMMLWQDNFWSDWLTYKDIAYRALQTLADAKFDIKREPREFALCRIKGETVWREIEHTRICQTIDEITLVREVIK